MATPAYMKLKGQKSGDVKGSVKVKGREDSIEVIAFNHEVRMPTDPQTGRLAGVRRHEPIVVTKAFDKSSPILYQMACTGELITDLNIDWYEIKPDGKEAIWYKHTLKNAQITSIRAVMPNLKVGESRDRAAANVAYEEVSFMYGSISWEVVEGGIMATDDWQQTRD